MAIYLKNSWNVPPVRWGSFADVRYALKVNAEKIYSIDSELIVLSLPLFMGFPFYDYSKYNREIVNYGTLYKNNVISFDGSSYINCGSDSSVNFNNVSFTFGGRFKVNGISSNNRLIGKVQESYSIYEIVTGQVTNKFSFYLRDSSGDNTGWVSSTSTFSSNIFYNIYVTVDRTTEIAKLYVDGEEEASIDVSSVENISPTGSLNIGKLFNSFLAGFSDLAYVSRESYTTEQMALFSGIPYGLYQKVSRPFYLLPIAVPTGNSSWYFNMLKKRNA